MNGANAQPVITTPTTMSMLNEARRNSDRSSRGCATRSSVSTKTSSAAAASANEASVTGVAQPLSPPWIRA